MAMIVRAGAFALGLVLVGLLLPSAAADARERIISFDSDITVHEDASMTVRETITVISERRDIRRGIFRDFPTRYRTARGTRVKV
ncbi:MAG TPA: DUF2207 domain-containing protein, partial [Alphaproteobacteria bacterium]|nr:DUF2207 domain-containing protein [Alphaproteobacteria bacterium]